MHAFLIAAAVALAAQVTSGGGDRYPPGATIASGSGARGAATTPQEQPASGGDWLKNSQASPSTSPQQPASQSGLGLPARQPNYRSRGSQQPAAHPADSQTTAPGKSLQPNQFAVTTNTAPSIKPSKLIAKLLKPPTTGQLAGSPLTLAEAVQGASSRSEQTRRVEAYWDLSTATANYYLALREVTALKTLHQSVLQPSADWEQAGQALSQRGRAARRAAQTAQVRLQRMIGQTGGALPVPSDLPHCGAYDTRYDEIFGGRPASAEAKQLHELLPLERQNLRQQATSVAGAEQWLNIVSERRDSRTDGSGLLKAHELLSLRRRNFVQALGSYNANIARYAEIASPGNVGTDRLVAMLIRTEGNRNIARSSGGIRRASAEESLGGRRPGGSSTQTFAEGQWNQTRRAETPQQGIEHSILTQPAGK